MQTEQKQIKWYRPVEGRDSVVIYYDGSITLFQDVVVVSAIQLSPKAADLAVYYADGRIEQIKSYSTWKHWARQLTPIDVDEAAARLL